MKNIHRILILMTILLCHLKAYSQDNYLEQQVEKIVPVSPNAASLGTYGNIPVGHYTGVPNISIPFYEIKLDGLVIPIELTYHASGIKAAQEASVVGLGWALNAGGCITRQVQHWDDFDWTNQGGYYFDSNFPKANSDNDNDINAPENSDQKYYNYLAGNKDSQPDIFSYNFAGHSGNFVFNKWNTGKNTRSVARALVTNKKEYLDIKYDIDNKTFEIFDGIGNKYIFRSYETTHMFSHTATSPSGIPTKRSTIRERDIQPKVITAWYLDQIITYKGESVRFNYLTEEIYTQMHTSEDASFLLTDKGTGSKALAKKYRYFNTSYSRIEQKVLKSVVFPAGELIFDYSDRVDIESTDKWSAARKLDGITVKNNLGEVVRKMNFRHSYFGNTALYSNARLCLDKVEIADPSTSMSVQEYSFKYHTALRWIPDKNTKYTDYWGYFNTPFTVRGSMAFESSPPVDAYYIDANTNKNMVEKIGGIDKSADENWTKAFVLTSITYPTGGKSYFEYELNEFSNFTTTKAEMVGLPTPIYNKYEVEGETRMIGEEFSVAERTEIEAFFNSYYETWNYIYNDVRVILEQKDRTFYHPYREFIMNHAINEGDLTVSARAIFNIPAGTYRFRIERIDEKCFQITGGANYIKTETSNKGAGLRIKSINDNPGGQQGEICKTYVYNYDGKTTGLLMVVPQHHYYFAVGIDEWVIYPGAVFTYYRSGLYVNSTTNPQTPLAGGLTSQTIGYSYVEEKAYDNSSGYTAYNFINRPNEMVYISDLPVRNYPTKPFYNNGALTRVDHYASGNKLLKTEAYEYELLEQNSLKGLVVDKLPILPMDDGQKRYYAVKFYDIPLQRWALSKKTETDYFDNNRSVVKTTEYGYNSVNFKSNYEKTTVNGDLIIDQSKYPNDYVDSNHYGMITEHLVDMPIETTQSVNGMMISGSMIGYSKFGTKYLPESVMVFNDDPGVRWYKERGRFDKYNNMGKLLQYSDATNVPCVFIWSYGGQNIVAQIKNASYEQVERLLGTVFLNELYSSDNPTSVQMARVDALRDQLPDTEVTTYTYKPLVGITSVKDPSGRSIRYSYDSMGRLTQVSDAKGVVEKYEYNYQTSK